MQCCVHNHQESSETSTTSFLYISCSSFSQTVHPTWKNNFYSDFFSQSSATFCSQGSLYFPLSRQETRKVYNLMWNTDDILNLKSLFQCNGASPISTPKTSVPFSRTFLHVRSLKTCQFILGKTLQSPIPCLIYLLCQRTFAGRQEVAHFRGFTSNTSNAAFEEIMPKQLLQSRPSWSPGGDQAPPHCWNSWHHPAAKSYCQHHRPVLIPQSILAARTVSCHLSHHLSEYSPFMDSLS